MKDFIEKQLDQCWKNLDKLMVCFLFIIAMGAALMVSFRGGMDEGTLDWGIIYMSIVDSRSILSYN